VRGRVRPLDQFHRLHRRRGEPGVQAGAAYANAEFIQVHPTAIPGADKRG